MVLLHGESCSFSTIFPKMAAGGKAYAPRCYHGRLSASTAVSRGSIWIVWPSLDSMSATTFSFELLVFWYTRSPRFSITGHKVSPTSCLLACLCMTPLWCCRWLSELFCLSRGPETLLRLGKLLLVPVQFMCSLLSGRDQVTLAVYLFN